MTATLTQPTPGHRFSATRHASLRLYSSQPMRVPLLPPPFSPLMLGGLQSAPPHSMPFWGPLCRGNPSHVVTHCYLCPSTLLPSLPPFFFSPGVVTGYDACCCASCLATVHLAVTVPLLSICSVYLLGVWWSFWSHVSYESLPKPDSFFLPTRTGSFAKKDNG